MISKEKVRELAKFIAKEQSKKALVYWSEIENNIKEWLEHSQPEPVVVGLSDEQIDNLSLFILKHPNIPYAWELKEWLKTQPKVKQVPVVLSEQQIEDLANFISKNGSEYSYLSTVRAWNNTQVVTPPQVEVGQVLHYGVNETATVLDVTDTQVAWKSSDDLLTVSPLDYFIEHYVTDGT